MHAASVVLRKADEVWQSASCQLQTHAAQQIFTRGIDRWCNQSSASSAKTFATGGDGPSIAEELNEHVPKPAYRGIMIVPLVPIDAEIKGRDGPNAR